MTQPTSPQFVGFVVSWNLPGKPRQLAFFADGNMLGAAECYHRNLKASPTLVGYYFDPLAGSCDACVLCERLLPPSDC